MTPLNTIKEKLESFKSRFTPIAMVLRWAWNGIKWAGISIGSVYIGFKWVQAEFKAIAKEEITHVESKIQVIRAVDLQHIDKRFDRIETLIIRGK